MRSVILTIVADYTKHMKGGEKKDKRALPASSGDFPFIAFIEQLQGVAEQFSQIVEGIHAAAAAATCIEFTASFR
jgi:hypothetical protein